MIRRKKFDDEHENHERWLVSYADFITLLFAFFVVMYAISSVNQGKYKELTSSLGDAFGSGSSIIKLQNGGDSARKNSIIKPLPLDQRRYEKLMRQREAMTAMAKNLSTSLAPLVEQGKIHVILNNRGIRIDISDGLLFSPGSAELSEAALGPLGEIAKVLQQNTHAIQVEGHTDNIPIHNDQFFSNWELSAVRASSVVRMFSGTGILENRLSAVGFGSAQPISDNDTLEGRSRNRRVSIMILNATDVAANADASEISPQNPAR